MDYTQKASDLLEVMQSFRKVKTQINFFEHLQGEMFVLYFIAFHDIKTLPGIISKEMNVSSARVAVALNSLENKGLITRQIAEDDRRKILVEITPAGRVFVQEHNHLMILQLSRLLEKLGENDANELYRLVTRLVEVIPELLA